jgi:hypothetical protein
LILTIEDIQKEVDKLEKESKAFKKQIYKLAWFMRGSLSVSEAFNMDLSDMEILNSVIDDNLKITKETKMPFF